MTRRAAAGVLLAGLALLTPACGGPFSPLDRQREALEAAQRVWRGQGFTSYEFRVQRLCFCVPTSTAPLLVRVQDGQPVAVTHAETGAPVTPDASMRLTVEALFAVIDEAIDSDAFGLEVAYHDVLGYPTSIGIDYRREIADDEVTFRASNLRPLR